jgi:subtilisin family serine protease
MGLEPVGVSRLLIGALAAAALSCWGCAPNSSTQPSSTLAWHLQAIGAGDAWKVTQGEGVVIAILDSGLADAKLPGLRAREVSPQPEPDTIGHGTAVTTLAAGSGDLGVWGVAPRARVLSLTVTDASGMIGPDAIVADIYSAVREGASVINMSFGQAADNPRIKTAIDYAFSHGVVIVAAGGDTASPAPLFPADVGGEVIAVRALGENGKPSLYANRIGVDGIDAPGQNLPAVRVQDNTVEVVGSDGSSMAAAVVSGSVALLEACAHRTSGAVLDEAAVIRVLRESTGQGPWFNLRAALRLVGC